MRVFAALLMLAAAPQDRDGGTPFTYPDGNYKLVYPKGYAKSRAGGDLFQLSLSRLGNFIAISGLETEAGVEEIVQSIEDGQRQSAESFKSLGRAMVPVAGVRAMQLRGTTKREGISMTFLGTVFTHQGVAYRVIGVHATGPFAQFEKEYQSILTSFAFLGDRKDWLERFEGKPARTAFLGGLASLELNRPRWRETTLHNEHDYGWLETLTFDFMGQSAWLTLRGRLSSRDSAAELERLREDLEGRIKKAKATATSWKRRTGELAGLEISGEREGEPYFIRAFVAIDDGVAVDCWLEGYERQKALTKKDWDQLIGGFTLQARTKPGKPVAYPLKSWDMDRSPNAALAVVLAKAVRVVPGGPGIAAVSPDGSKVLLHEREVGNFLVDTATGKRTKMSFEPAAPEQTRWSADGKRLLWPGDEGLCVATVDPPEVRTVGVRAVDAAFGFGEGELLASTVDREDQDHPSSRLERIDAKEDRKVLVDFPLSRVLRPALSPDGKRLAVVTNRDYPRSATLGGHLYVAAADGTNLRQLTRDPEQISEVCWSSDGKSLFVVRRLSRGKDGAVGMGGSEDLWRISAETGEAKNLTRSDHIAGAWVAGDDLFLWVSYYGLPESQRGLFRIATAELEKASSTLSEPPIADAAAQGQAVAAKVRAAVGGAPIRDVIPTPERMAVVAQAFAAAVKESCGLTLDFSRKSLDDLTTLVWSLGLREGDPALVLGMGAYYGETLKATSGAEWMLQPVPFGDGSPALAGDGTPLADPILPFSDVVAQALGSEDSSMRGGSDLAQLDQGRKLILIHPPASMDDAVRKATGPEYYEARRKLDAGDVRPALDLLAKELERRPRNRTLAREVIKLCEAARLPEVVKSLTKTAVEAGNEVPELLLRYAEDVAPADPAKAQDALRKAVGGDYAPAAAFLRLGKAYAAAGDRPLAEACWRRAFAGASQAEKSEIHSLMGVQKAAATDE